MKALIQILLIFLLSSQISCKDDHVDATQNEVDLYIAQLKSGNYSAIELPPFTFEAIPDLLKYRNNTERITQFPRNPISSFYNPETTIGMFALWTIESIREANLQTNDNPLPGRFPSLSPNLAKLDADGIVVEELDIAQPIAASAYASWWESSKNISVYDLIEIDPLKNQDYQWM